MREVPQLGKRGGGWALVQFPLMALVLAAGLLGPGWPEWAARTLSVAGVVLAVGGGALVVYAARSLGPSLTPYPRPNDVGSLVERGPYRVVRHPVYLGGVLFFAGFSLAFSPLALVGTAALGLLWGLKASVEEGFLRARYPEYVRYCERTRFRLFPLVY